MSDFLSKFRNAVLGATMADLPAVMTASGWRQNEKGDYVLDLQNDPHVKLLRDNLAAEGAGVMLGEFGLPAIHGLYNLGVRGLGKAGNNWARATLISKEMKDVADEGLQYFGKVKYYGPTMGKTTAAKTNFDLADFDDVTRKAKNNLAKELNIPTRVLQSDPKYALAYLEMLEKLLDSWRRNPLNTNKTLVISKKGLADKNIYNNEPSIPDRQTFVQRLRNRGETDDANSNDWYNMLLKLNPNLKIDNRFVSEIEYNPHYIGFQPTNQSKINYFKDKYGREVTPTPYPGPDSDLANAVLHSLRSVLRDYYSPEKINQIKTTMNWGDLEISELLSEILRTIGNGPDVLIKGPMDGFTDIALHRGLIINSGSEAKGLSTVVLNRERIPDVQMALESGIHEIGVHGKTASLKPENFGKGGRDDMVKEWFPRLAELSLKNKELADLLLQPNRVGKFLGLFLNVGDLEKYFVNKGLSWDKWQKFYDAWKRYKYVTASDETTARAYTGLLFNKVYDPTKKTLNIKLLELYNTPESVEAFKKAVLGVAPVATAASLIPSDKKGSKILIKKKNRGKFTEYCGGEVTNECILKAKNSKNPTLRKRATFALNARGWSKKKQDGGTMFKTNFVNKRPVPGILTRKHEEGAKIHKPDGHRAITDNGWIPTKRLKKGTYGLIKKHRGGGSAIPTVEEYIALQIEARKQAALNKSLTRTLPAYPLKNEVMTEQEWNDSLVKREQSTRNSVLPQSIKALNIVGIDSERRAGYANYVGSNCIGPTCAKTAADNYGVDFIGSQLFRDNHANYGFKKVDNKSVKPGDIVIDVELGLGSHTMMFNRKDNNNVMRFNHSNGGFLKENIRKDAKYPFKGVMETYTFVGTPSDSILWRNEYKHKYE